MSAPLPFRTDRVRLLIFLKRKEGLSKEDFSKHWRGPHGKLFMSMDIVKKNALKYEQAHTNDKFLHAGEQIGLTTPEWDGVVFLDGESYEKLYAIFASEEYETVVKPDEENFLDRSKCQILPVDLVTLFE